MPFGLSTLAVKAIGIGLLVLAILSGLALFTAHEQGIGAAKAEAAQVKQALAGEQAARIESERRVVAIQQKADHADVQASAARADADAARSADDRLRLRLAAAERRRTAVDSATPGASAPADAPAFVPYDVFAGIDGAAGQLGDYADQLRISLDACIGSYNALTPSTP